MVFFMISNSTHSLCLDWASLHKVHVSPWLVGKPLRVQWTMRARGRPYACALASMHVSSADIDVSRAWDGYAPRKEPVRSLPSSGSGSKSVACVRGAARGRGRRSDAGVVPDAVGLAVSMCGVPRA